MEMGYVPRLCIINVLRAEKDFPLGDGLRLYFFQRDGQDRIGIPRPVVIDTTLLAEEVSPSIDPLFRLNNTEAQVLIDSLWDCGLRPTEGHGGAGQLAATERHLADMKRIASDCMEVVLEKARAKP